MTQIQGYAEKRSIQKAAMKCAYKMKGTMQETVSSLAGQAFAHLTIRRYHRFFSKPPLLTIYRTKLVPKTRAHSWSTGSPTFCKFIGIKG